MHACGEPFSHRLWSPHCDQLILCGQSLPICQDLNPIVRCALVKVQINLLFGDYVEACYPYMECSTLTAISGTPLGLHLLGLPLI